MADSYVTQLIGNYTAQLKKHIERQDPRIVGALGTVTLQLRQLEQARDRCALDTQLYCINRISRILGEIDGYLVAKEEKDVQAQADIV